MNSVESSFIALIFPDHFGERSEILFYEKGTPYSKIYEDIFKYSIPVFKEEGLNLEFIKFMEEGNRGYVNLVDNDSFKHVIAVLNDESTVLSYLSSIYSKESARSMRLSLKLQKLCANTGKVLLPKQDSFEKYITRLLTKPKYMNFIKATTPELPIDTYNLSQFNYRLANTRGEIHYIVGYATGEEDKIITIAYNYKQQSFRVILGVISDVYRPFITVPDTVCYELQRRTVSMLDTSRRGVKYEKIK